MEQIRSLAFISVGRGVTFTFYGVGLLVLALSFDPPFALKVGGTLSLILCLVLVQRAAAARRADPRRTEVWTMLAVDQRPNEAGRALICGVLCETYLRFARGSAAAAIAFFAAAFLLALAFGGGEA